MKMPGTEKKKKLIRHTLRHLLKWFNYSKARGKFVNFRKTLSQTFCSPRTKDQGYMRDQAF